MKRHPGFMLAALVQVVVSTFTTSAHPGSGIVVDAQGRVYFNEAGDPAERLPGSIWQIDAQGKLTRLKVGGAHYLALDTKKGFAQSNLSAWFGERITPWLQLVDTPDAALIQADGQPLAAHRDGSLYFAKRNLDVVRLMPDGKQTTIVPTLEATVEKLGGIKGVAFGPDDNLYVACPSAIVKVKADGTFSTVAHPIAVPDCSAEFPPETPESHSPFLRGLAVDTRGTIFAAATGCRAVVKVSPDGESSVVMRAEAPWSPTGVAVRGDDVYVLEYEHPHSQNKVDWRPRVRKLARDGKVTTLVTLPTAQSRPVTPEPKQ
jgi:sugar lactone lactonase YvrE